ncbi:Retrovirus-related Pol polyprotein, partial [Mucuna pruriens]
MLSFLTPSTQEKYVSPQLQTTELKSLPKHLKYAYLGDSQQFPIIIANNLNREQEEKLLEPTFQGSTPPFGCTKFYWRRMPDRLNLTLLNVVKKEFAKLLATRIIYPISDSQWVSPVQVVPKKSGMMVIKNRQDETEAESSNLQGPLSIAVRRPSVRKISRCSFRTFAYRRMSFRLYNTLSTFQICMINIFSNLLEDYMEVSIDDFIVYAESFEACLDNLSRVLRRCIDSNLVLNFEKCHFVVTKGIVLGYLVSTRGIEVDKAKIDVIFSLPNPAFVSEVRSFLGHADFNKIALPLSNLLQKDANFVFDQSYVDAFQELKRRLTFVPILQAPNWALSFELMCDASNFVLGAVLGQRVGKQPHVITYASRTMDATQVNYTTTKKELLAIIFALDMFNSYLLGSKIVIFSDHATLKYHLKKPDVKLRLIIWICFSKKIKDKKGAENVVADHLSRLEREAEPIPTQDEFLDEQIL